MVGRTLIEVMIALTLGLVILLAITSLFVTNKQTYRTSDDKTRLDEEGYLALNLIAFNVRMAGYGSLTSALTHDDSSEAVPKPMPPPAVYTNLSGAGLAPGVVDTGTAPNVIFGCANGFADSSSAVAACAPGTTSDAFLVRYVIDARNANLTAGGVPTDCLGAGVVATAAATPFFIVENRFFSQISPTTGVPELYCQGNGNTLAGANFANPAQPITENVEQIKVTYGVSAGGQSVARSMTADGMTSADWRNVISAKICLVVRSANNNITTKAQTYRDCSNAVVVAPDRRLRGVFSSTITLRNRITGAL